MSKVITDQDLYQLLGVEANADDTAIKTAYRKKALSCHPDKNPNDEQAGDTFHQLTEALTILTNPKSRKSYDNLLKSRKLANSGRQKIKIVQTAPEREYNKNETTDEDEENELYEHPDFENVKVSGQRIKPKRYISIELKRQILVFSIGIFIIFVTCLVFISRNFHQNQKEDTDKWIGELEPKNPMNQPDHFEIQHPKLPFLQNQRVLATSDVYKRILTDFNETDHSKPRALP